MITVRWMRGSLRELRQALGADPGGRRAGEEQALRAWLRQQLSQLMVVGEAWPGRAVQGELTIEGNARVRLLFVPADDHSSWRATVLPGGEPATSRDLTELTQVLTTARLRFEPRGVIEAAGIVIDTIERRLTGSGLDVRLTRLELGLLGELARHAGQVLTAEGLLGRVWERPDVGRANLEWLVGRVRRKLGDHAYLLVTVPGVGYRLGAPPPAETRIVGELILDRAGRRAWLSMNEIELSRAEFNLLYALTDHPGTVVPYGQLLVSGWGSRPPVRKVLVKTIIRLRRKLGDHMSIVAVRGSGYRLLVLGCGGNAPTVPVNCGAQSTRWMARAHFGAPELSACSLLAEVAG